MALRADPPPGIEIGTAFDDRPAIVVDSVAPFPDVAALIHHSEGTGSEKEEVDGGGGTEAGLDRIAATRFEDRTPRKQQA